MILCISIQESNADREDEEELFLVIYLPNLHFVGNANDRVVWSWNVLVQFFPTIKLLDRLGHVVQFGCKEAVNSVLLHGCLCS